jgi:hypothetical protein
MKMPKRVHIWYAMLIGWTVFMPLSLWLGWWMSVTFVTFLSFYTILDGILTRIEAAKPNQE